MNDYIRNMEQRDYIMVQIEQLGAVLKALLSSILGNPQGQSDTGIPEDINTVFNDDLKLDLNHFIADDLTLETLNDQRWTLKNLDILSSVLKAYAEDKELTREQRKNLLKHTLEICKKVDSESDAYSLDLHSRINEITIELDNLD